MLCVNRVSDDIDWNVYILISFSWLLDLVVSYHSNSQFSIEYSSYIFHQQPSDI